MNNLITRNNFSVFVDSADSHIHRRRAPEEPEGIRKITKVGESEYLQCNINYPTTDQYIDYFIFWFRHGSEAPIFVQHNGDSHTDLDYLGRIRLVESATIELMQIEKSDEAWYRCSIRFPEFAEHEPNDTWIYLQVDCEY